MSEHRVRPARHKGQLNFEQELTQALFAFGDSKHPLPETVRILDEIVTDYVIDTVQTASKAATVSGRGKVKADDFKFAIRHDEVATGRVKELLTMEKSLKDARKQFDTGEGKVGLERGPRGRKRKVDAAAAVGGEARGGGDAGTVKREKHDGPGGEEDELDEDV
ncbi:MAG: hypothetical protein OHK93_006575 [Ramalina farinacea]|uniref:Transcription initiation factor TFIID subunit 13 n=1 Tax=Ramalina farinacea TaxID=258253 RepID=A0AA43TQ83_9LECA|nr:hypothetical protein [Ramalina farinacea]